MGNEDIVPGFPRTEQVDYPKNSAVVIRFRYRSCIFTSHKIKNYFAKLNLYDTCKLLEFLNKLGSSRPWNLRKDTRGTPGLKTTGANYSSDRIKRFPEGPN